MRRGFTLIEILVVIAIIGVIASIMFVSFSGSRDKARDAKRKAEVFQFGKLLTLGCYVPDAGVGEYDLLPLAQELAGKYPQYAAIIQNVPKDPKQGSATQSGYKYIVDTNSKCVLYANLESDSEKTTLGITTPTAGGGTGILQSATAGPNGSTKYFQYSN